MLKRSLGINKAINPLRDIGGINVSPGNGIIAYQEIVCILDCVKYVLNRETRDSYPVTCLFFF